MTVAEEQVAETDVRPATTVTAKPAPHHDCSDKRVRTPTSVPPTRLPPTGIRGPIGRKGIQTTLRCLQWYNKPLIWTLATLF